MTTGADLIAAERQRQVEVEDWTPEYDARHRTGELARAAGCYAAPNAGGSAAKPYTTPPHAWPWPYAGTILAVVLGGAARSAAGRLVRAAGRGGGDDRGAGRLG